MDLSPLPPGVPSEIDVPVADLGITLREATAAYPDRVALDFFGSRTTYLSLSERVSKAAALLQSLGVGHGTRVAIIAPNCPQHVVAFYATLRLGAIAVLHNPTASPAELSCQLADHEATVVLAWQGSLALLSHARSLLPEGQDRIEHVIAIDMVLAMPRRLRFALALPVKAARTRREELRAPSSEPDWDRLVDASSPLPDDHPLPRSEDVAAILYTGGTTGAPKGAMLTHRNLLANLIQGAAWTPTLRDGEETFYAVLPFFHAFGLTLSLTFGVKRAATIVLFPKPDVPLFLAAQRRQPCTFLSAVPTLLDRIAEAAVEREANLSSIRIAISGAMALPVATATKWEDLTGGLLIEGYGMTESSPCLLGNPVSGERRPGFIGLPFPSTEIQIVDTDDPTQPTPPGGIGELIARGPQVFAGYWGRPEETAQVLLPGGWLRTGDKVTIDRGMVRLVDRVKEVIITGGFNVYPSEVELQMRQIPGVVDVAVVGIPSGPIGERVVAAVVMAAGASVPDLAAIKNRLADRVSRYAIPREIHQFDDLPRSQVGKVLRRVVRDNILERVHHRVS